VLHCGRVALGVHLNQVPAVEGDGRVVGVANAPLDVDLRVSLHLTPSHAEAAVPVRLSLHAAAVELLLGDSATGEGGVNVNGLAPAADHHLAVVGLRPATSGDRLVLEDDGILARLEAGLGDEEPFPLTAETVVVAAVAVLAADASAALSLACGLRLESLHRLVDAVDAVPRDRSDEPVALVVSAEELVLLAVIVDVEEQVAELGVEVHDLDLDVLVRADVENAVVDINADATAVPAVGADAPNLCVRTDGAELLCDACGIHVASFPAPKCFFLPRLKQAGHPTQSLRVLRP